MMKKAGIFTAIAVLAAVYSRLRSGEASGEFFGGRGKKGGGKIHRAF